MSSTKIIHGHVCEKCGHNRFRTKDEKRFFACRKCGTVRGYCSRPKAGKEA